MQIFHVEFTLVNFDMRIYTFDQKQAVLTAVTFEGTESQRGNKMPEATEQNRSEKIESSSN